MRKWIACGGLLLIAACGRTREDAGAASFEGGGLHVEVSTPSGAVREGETELRVRIRDGEGAPVDDARVSVQYSMPMAGMPSMGGRVEAEPIGDGEYRAAANIEMAVQFRKPVRLPSEVTLLASAAGSSGDFRLVGAGDLEHMVGHWRPVA